MATAEAKKKKAKSPKGNAGAAADGAAGERLASLDALRGFNMFWIAGGVELVRALAGATGWHWAKAVAGQLDRAPWAGCRGVDLIFPLFLFISGVSLTLAVGKRMDGGAGRAAVVLRLVRRALLLVLLGAVYNAGRVTFDISNMRLCSALGFIGLAGLGAGLIMIVSHPRVWAACAFGILVLYWVLLAFVPVPGQGGASFEQGRNLADAIDRLILPGRLFAGNHDSEGILTTLSAVAMVLLGALAGAWLVTGQSAARKLLGFAAAGGVLLGVGLLWGRWFPMIPNLWTSSFVLYSAGWGCLLLAAFYGVIDGLGLRRWAYPFILIGVNSLALYLLRGTGLIDFAHIGRFLFSFLYSNASTPVAALCGLLATLSVQFAFLYWLQRGKLFLRV